MQNRRWWGLGLLGIALAGTIALVIPSEAQTGAMLARNDYGAARQPDRAVQQEAQAIANRIDEALRRSSSLLQTIADADLTVFERERIGLNAASSQWPVALFTATPGKGSDFSVQPPGERYLSPEDVTAIQKQGVWIAERSPLKSVLIAVPSRTGQVLASRVPFHYFSQGLNALPRPNGVRRYLLDASGKPLEGEVAPSGEDRDWCQQLLQLGEGFLATSDAMFSVARVPSTGWAVVVRHPIGHTNPLLSLDPGTLAGPTMVASGPLQAPGLPKGILLYPLAGAALLFGLAIVGWKQRWPGLEDGPIAFGENAFKTVTAPLRDRFDRRMPLGESLPASSETSLATFAAEVPSKLPAAIAGDVDFLRTEQIRNLREVWSHTEERLSGQRTWVRDEVRRVQESTTTSISELGSIVNLAEQRLEDARSAWSDVQASLLARIDEARGGLADQQEVQAEFRHTVEDQLSDLRHALTAEQEAREEQGKRLAKGLGDLATGLESENTARSGQDAQLAKDLSDAQAALQAALDAETKARELLGERLSSDVAGLKGELATGIEGLKADLAAGDAEIRSELRSGLEGLKNDYAADLSGLKGELASGADSLKSDLDALGTLMNEEFTRLDGVLQAARTLLSELDAREADSRSQWQTALTAQAERNDQLVGELAEARQALAAELADQATKLQRVVAEAQTELGAEMAAIADRTRQLGTSLEALESRVGDQHQGTDGRLTELQALVQEALPPLRQELEALRDLSGAVEQISYRLDAHAERFEGLSALEGRLLDLGKRMDERFADLDIARRSIDERVEAANARVLEQADALEEANERLFGLGDEIERVSEALEETRSDIGSLSQRVDNRVADTQGNISELQGRHEALDRRFETLDRRTEKLEDHGKAIDATLTDLTGKVSEQARTQGELKGVSTEFAGLKGRLEGMSLAHARQQEALNAAVQQITSLQQAFEAKAADTALQSQVEELTRFVQQLAEQSQLLAQALEASTVAASRSEGMLGEQLGQIRSEQTEAVSALTRENAALREALDGLRENNEALSNRMHMVVQVLSKISK